MKPLASGVAIAVVLAGPPLYSLEQAGSITGSTALFRGLVVAGVCTLGSSFLGSIIRSYAAQAQKKSHGEVVHHPSEQAGSGTASGRPAPGQTIPGQTIPGQTVPTDQAKSAKP